MQAFKIYGILAIVAIDVALAFVGCSAEGNNDATPIREATWAITSACKSCLATECGFPDGGTPPMADCIAQNECNDAFGEFANCYHLNRSLSACQDEVELVKQSGDAGRDLLLNCFLLDCFADTCDGSQVSAGT